VRASGVMRARVRVRLATYAIGAPETALKGPPGGVSAVSTLPAFRKLRKGRFCAILGWFRFGFPFGLRFPPRFLGFRRFFAETYCALR